jgi:hypothetical protein
VLGNTSVKMEVSHVIVTHCLSNKHALATKTVPTTLKKFCQQP